MCAVVCVHLCLCLLCCCPVGRVCRRSLLKLPRALYQLAGFTSVVPSLTCSGPKRKEWITHFAFSEALFSHKQKQFPVQGQAEQQNNIIIQNTNRNSRNSLQTNVFERLGKFTWCDTNNYPYLADGHLSHHDSSSTVHETYLHPDRCRQKAYIQT